MEQRRLWSKDNAISRQNIIKTVNSKVTAIVCLIRFPLVTGVIFYPYCSLTQKSIYKSHFIYFQSIYFSINVKG